MPYFFLLLLEIVDTPRNLFQSNFAFHIQASHLFCSANQLTGFYIMGNTDCQWLTNSKIRLESIKFWSYPVFLTISWITLNGQTNFKNLAANAGQTDFNSLSTNFTNWSNTLNQFVGNFPTNCLKVSDHFGIRA